MMVEYEKENSRGNFRMKNKEKKKVKKYSELYSSIGMCLGLSFGSAFGMILFPDNMSIGMCLGMPIGMCIGMVLGAEKDKQLSENRMIIDRIERIPGEGILVYVTDKNGKEKEYCVSEKKMKNEKFAVGNRVAEDIKGSLESLES